MTDFSQIHKPVLLQECVDLVTPALHASDSVAVDCTLGLAGHTIAFLKAAPNATVIGIDRDEEALDKATARIAQEGLSARFVPVHAAFDQFDEVLRAQGVSRVQAVFMDRDCRVCRLMNANVGSRMRMMRRSTCAWTPLRR